MPLLGAGIGEPAACAWPKGGAGKLAPDEDFPPNAGGLLPGEPPVTGGLLPGEPRVTGGLLPTPTAGGKLPLRGGTDAGLPVTGGAEAGLAVWPGGAARPKRAFNSLISRGFLSESAI
jgi:hypothetical protein